MLENGKHHIIKARMMMMIIRTLTIQDGERHIFMDQIMKVIHIRKFPGQVFLVFKNYNTGTPLEVHWLRLHASPAGVRSLAGELRFHKKQRNK